jgi:polyphenol oxidase
VSGRISTAQAPSPLAGARSAFSSRDEGNVSLVVGAGDPASARAALLERVGLDTTAAVFMEQVHGAGVAVVAGGDRGRGLTDHADAVAGADALVTTERDLGLVVMVADCVPVLLAVPDRGVAAVHAGREGVAAGIVGAAVSVLAAETGRPVDEVRARVGPAIGGCCYEVPDELAVELAAIVPGVRARTRWGTTSVDLPAAVRTQLRAAGVEQLEADGVCTMCNADVFFSHRATTRDGARAGRQAGVIRLGPPASDRSASSLDSP